MSELKKVEIKVDEIKDEKLDRRIAELRVGSSNTFQFLPAINLKKVKSSTVDAIGATVSENYVAITLKRLREMDSDTYEQEKFLKNNIKRNYTLNSFIVIKLLINQDDVIEKQDVEYLISLLSTVHNFVFITPLVYNYKHIESIRKLNGKEIRIENDIPTTPINSEKYLQFAKLFIDGVKSVTNTVCLTLQKTFTNKKTEELVKLYNDVKVPFALIDLKAGIVENVEPQLNTLKRLLNKKEGNEGYALYSFDMKPSRLHKKDNFASSRGLLYSLFGFSSFGPLHTVTVGPMDKPPKIKIYNQKEYGYVYKENPQFRITDENYNKWVSSLKIEDNNKSNKYRFLREYEYSGIIKSASEIFNKNLRTKELLNDKTIFSKDVEIIKRTLSSDKD